ncbi:hypothetical protein [Cupriavidus necator]|uniref:hypothetical protein n=1 Tax=Cupriavidus necator TaxID=106590 RepID=UPI0005B32612|nr:hypothetical protein [Cupriavidus necator]
MSDLVPLDRLLIPIDLSGARGRNRAGGRAQIAAPDDRSAAPGVTRFLPAEYREAVARPERIRSAGAAP